MSFVKNIALQHRHVVAENQSVICGMLWRKLSKYTFAVIITKANAALNWNTIHRLKII